MVEASKLPQPIFTPSSKAEVGDHDINISYEECERQIGQELAAKVRDAALKLYTEAANYALTKGIIICDTKFEFGLDENGELTLMDEVLTRIPAVFGQLKPTEKAQIHLHLINNSCVTGWKIAVGTNNPQPRKYRQR